MKDYIRKRQADPGYVDDEENRKALNQQAECIFNSKDIDAALALDTAIAKLHEGDSRFSWTGVYLRRGEELVIGAFRGPYTPHSVIPLTGGICGAAVREERTLNIPDVKADPRYLSCDFRTKSEVVVPIFDTERRVIGEIDIDSHQIDAFTKSDEIALERLAGELSSLVVKLVS